MGAHPEIAQWDTPNDHKLPMIDAKKLAHGKGASTVMASPKSLVTLDKHRKKKGSELTEALERGKAKGLKRATTALAAKIEDGEFQAIQFYLKSADREKWAERQIEVNHTLNLAHILEDAQARIIDLPRAKASAEAPTARAVERLEKIKGKG